MRIRFLWMWRESITFQSWESKAPKIDTSRFGKYKKVILSASYQSAESFGQLIITGKADRLSTHREKLDWVNMSTGNSGTTGNTTDDADYSSSCSDNSTNTSTNGSTETSDSNTSTSESSGGSGGGNCIDSSDDSTRI